jgi:hypothetical protein
MQYHDFYPMGYTITDGGTSIVLSRRRDLKPTA